MNNIFLPLFEVTNDANSHPELHKFLQYVSRFLTINVDNIWNWFGILESSILSSL